MSSVGIISTVSSISILPILQAVFTHPAPISNMAFSDNTEDSLPSFNIQLAPDDGEGGFHFDARNNPARPFQRETIHDDRRGVSVKCSLVDVAHGKYSPESQSEDASLVVFGFRFDRGSNGSGHIKAATITVTFLGEYDDEDHPGVMDHSFNGTYRLLETTQTESVTRGTGGSVSGSVLNAAQVTLDRKYEKVVTRQTSDATYISGSSCMLGVDYDPDNAVQWKLRENETMGTGVPVYLRVGVLLQRPAQAKFRCTVEINTDVDLKSKIKRFLGEKPRDDPVIFHPGMKATNRLREYNVLNLGGGGDLAEVDDVTFTTVISGAIKHVDVDRK
ncbi:hypothetical protein ASPVEDRAFT_40850 [Aspergillus versicolor CBS 583.65]|uniref:Uncharacterized protein n=1 Tax=Aspergillus versicolor CBS 583.65 TaxID=1036611 RepID=A0A1L9PIC6_ASPVE|nr:uncharacterized protein ASPVEDRAFT_40850 [Aspergillus versicolor CBS 583.65]OJJ01279.1 hypothetical protein ASPVEDRAFT_40850 [Aspergillus versicolor CBS 583.65]